MFNLKLYIKNSSLYAKIKFALGRSEFGKVWQGKPIDWYYSQWDNLPLLHKNFVKYFDDRKNEIRTVLDLGCGAANYPLLYPQMFENKKYVGIDISETAIDHCKKNSPFEFFSGDFLKMNLIEEFSKRNLPKEYDLVYAHGVIDNVYDIELFLRIFLKCCKKYGYIHSCRGYHPNLEKHKMNWRDEDHCYYNDISIKQIKKFFLNNGLTQDEFNIRLQETGINGAQPHVVFEIIRKSG